MSKRLKILLSCMTILTLLCGLLLPCSAVMADIADTLVLDRQYGSASSSYSNYKVYNNQVYSQGLTTESNVSFASNSIIPNYYWEDFNIYSNTGLPIAEGGKSWQIALYNFYNYLYHEQNGTFFLKSINRIIYWCVYTDGTSSARTYNQGTFTPGTSSTSFSSFIFQISPEKDVKNIRVQLEFDYSDYGISMIPSTADPYDYMFVLGCSEFKVAREQVFPTADSGAFDDFDSAEQEALDASQDGIDEAANALEYAGSLIGPGGAVYNSILFWGNLMRDITVYIPDLSELLWISLGLGLCIVIVGGVTAVVAGRSNAVSKTSGNKKGG